DLTPASRKNTSIALIFDSTLDNTTRNYYVLMVRPWVASIQGSQGVITTMQVQVMIMIPVTTSRFMADMQQQSTTTYADRSNMRTIFLMKSSPEECVHGRTAATGILTWRNHCAQQW